MDLKLKVSNIQFLLPLHLKFLKYSEYIFSKGKAVNTLDVE
jgi:hypothetical protein